MFVCVEVGGFCYGSIGGIFMAPALYQYLETGTLKLPKTQKYHKLIPTP
jgi:hypothetical protein